METEHIGTCKSQQILSKIPLCTYYDSYKNCLYNLYSFILFLFIFFFIYNKYLFKNYCAKSIALFLFVFAINSLNIPIHVGPFLKTPIILVHNCLKSLSKYICTCISQKNQPKYICIGI